MGRLDAALKVVRLLSSVVWLLVGLVTLWGTWAAFRELGPYLRTLTAIIQEADPGGRGPQLPADFTPESLQRFFRAPGQDVPSVR